jgi:plasmid stabilization system protein ParE
VIIRWTAAAKVDLARFHTFLAPYDEDAANALLDLLVEAPEALLSFPRRGVKLTEFEPRQIHEFHVGSYRLRYELVGDELRVVRVFHVREDRF